MKSGRYRIRRNTGVFCHSVSSAGKHFLFINHLRADIAFPTSVSKLIRINICTVMNKMRFIRFNQIYIAVDTGTRVPAGVRIFIDGMYEHRVFAFVQEFRDVKKEGGVAVFPFSCDFVIYIKGGIHVNAFKQQGNAPA